MWLVKLKGQIADLELLESMLNTPEAAVQQENGTFYVSGTLFDGLADAHG